MSEALTSPAVLYPERQAFRKRSWLERTTDSLAARSWRRLMLRPDPGFAARVVDAGAWFEDLDDAALGAEAARLGRHLRRHGLTGGEPFDPGARGTEPRLPAQVAAFALVRETAWRTLGQRHFPVQLMAGRAMLAGAVVEMQPGEGKTLTATLAAATAALGGVPVHVVTANDYLAARDAETMAPLYGALGLSVGKVVQGMAPAARRAAYTANVVYCCNKEVVFDYLRDRRVMGQRCGNLALRMASFTRPGRPAPVLPGLAFAIVDEADSVLIDEARTPLILSDTLEDREDSAAIEAAVDLARTLEAEHFIVHAAERRLELTEAGENAVAEGKGCFPLKWQPSPIREEAVRTALSALHLYHRGEHYLVAGGKVEIVDEYTGRIMPDRSWGSGLHQAVEAKEGCPLSPRRRTIAQITYQRFFRRYRHICGMTGTAAEATAELWSVYRLPVVRMPTNRPVCRLDQGSRILAHAEARWAAVAESAARMRAAGRPVLIGTRTVDASEAASAALERIGVPHRVLNAAQDAEEAALVAAAGQPGAVTVATNMAGRGTDIVLGQGVAEAGGLHVILTERSAARRIDRQLIGRAGRQGDPGSFEALLSREDALLDLLGPGLTGRIARCFGRGAFALAQRKAEWSHARARRRLLTHDESLAESLAFTGPQE